MVFRSPALAAGIFLAAAVPPALSQERLTGTWVVEDIARRGIIDASRMTLEFDEPGRIAGSAGCNRYTATLAMDDGLSIGPIAATRRMCPEALMTQEQRFLDALSSVNRYEVDETGALLLSAEGEESPSIIARAE